MVRAEAREQRVLLLAATTAAARPRHLPVQLLPQRRDLGDRRAPRRRRVAHLVDLREQPDLIA